MFVLAIVLFAAVAVNGQLKPGTCPAPVFPGPTQPPCFSDLQCPGVQKCCPATPSTVGRRCRTPFQCPICVPGQHCEFINVFVGFQCVPNLPNCPANPPFPCAVPTHQCLYNWQCPWGTTCCHTTNNCGHKCYPFLFPIAAADVPAVSVGGSGDS